MRGDAATEPQEPVGALPRRREARTVNEPFNPAVIDAIASLPPQAAEQPREPGIHVFITDSQGREQHIVFASTEVTIGRERNNDLVLAEEGVSRHHAMLTADEDGICSIMDLGSTNGTVVNHRHIENVPTPLHARDRVALGQFVLRAVYVPGLGVRVPDVEDPPTEVGKLEVYRELASTRPPPAAMQLQPHLAPPYPAEPPPVRTPMPPPPPLEVPLPRRQHSTKRGGVDGPSTQVIHEAEQEALAEGRVTNVRGSSKAPASEAPGSAPQPPPSSRPLPPPSSRPLPPPSSRPAPPPYPYAAPVRPAAGPPRTNPAPPGSIPPAIHGQNRRATEPPSESLEPPPPSPAEVPRVEEAKNDAPPARPSGGEALSMLVGLLADESVRRVDIRQQRLIIKGENRCAFESDEAVAAAVAKVSGTTLHADQVVARAAFGGGWQLVALMPVDGGGHVVSFTRAPNQETTLAGLAHSGVLTTGAAALLAAAMEAQLGILVVGDRDGASSVVRALRGAALPGAHAAWLLTATRDPAPPDTTAVDIGDEETKDEAWEALATLLPDHVFAVGLFGEEMACLFELVARGTEGVIATASGSSMDAALGRMAGSVAAARGMATDAARSWMVASFSLGVEVARQRSGELRIGRLSWLGDGTTTPGHESLIVGGKVTTKARELVEQLRARGFEIDRATIEKR